MTGAEAHGGAEGGRVAGLEACAGAGRGRVAGLEELEFVAPGEIERRSMQIIEAELEQRGIELCPDDAPVVKRVIHTTADFDYAQALSVSPGAVDAGVKALSSGISVVTDTTMAAAGINKRVLAQFGGEVLNFIGDADVALEARERGVTRSAVCMERAAALGRPLVFAIGNAPTALVRLYELVEEGRIQRPKLIIGVPVGFVNVVESKELICSLDVPHIVARGRKGGSNVAAAIVNALLYATSR